MAGQPTIALLYRAARDRSDPSESRFAALFDAFKAAGVSAEPAVYNGDFADDVAAQLRRVNGVLVWCNPIEAGRRRDRLDALLREAAQAGVYVSTHPDTVLKLGTKDVLVDVRDLPFGSDAVRIDTLVQLAEWQLITKFRTDGQSVELGRSVRPRLGVKVSILPTATWVVMATGAALPRSTVLDRCRRVVASVGPCRQFSQNSSECHRWHHLRLARWFGRRQHAFLSEI
jgi:hypothetical protein